MKTKIILKEFSDLSFDVGILTDGTAPAIPELSPQPTPESVHDFQVPPDRSGESYRELLHQRYVAPFPCEPPYRHGGLNE